MNAENQRRIYILKDLPEETIAVCFAKCSRCPDDFAKIANQLDEDKSRRFHERWVVGYGHSSVAEHAVVHVALENVSHLVVEAIQSNRLASYTEKSSRYQIFDKSRYFVPPKIIKDRKYLKVYQEAVDSLFDLYHQSVDPIKKQIMLINPRQSEEDDQKYEGRIHSQYIDVVRMVLPFCTLANLGMTANARTYEYAITKMLSSSYEEVRQVGRQLKKEVLKVCPTLVKYAEKNAYYSLINKLDLTKETGKIFAKKRYPEKAAKVIWHDRFANERFISTMLYRFGRGDLVSLFQEVRKWSGDKKIKFIQKILSEMTEHDKPPRELEHVYITFDCLIDQGGYYDLKRNRMMTQTPQALSIDYGFIIPQIWVKAGLKKKYLQTIRAVEDFYRCLSKKYPFDAVYLVTKAHKRRFLMTMNLRELFYFVPLRGSPRGHFSYRRIAMKCYEEAKKIYPDLLRFVPIKGYLSSRQIEKEFFYQT